MQSSKALLSGKGHCTARGSWLGLDSLLAGHGRQEAYEAELRSDVSSKGSLERAISQRNCGRQQRQSGKAFLPEGMLTQSGASLVGAAGLTGIQT